MILAIMHKTRCLSALGVFFILCLSTLPQLAGQNPSTLTLTQLQERTAELVDNQDYIRARPLLLELVTRFEGESQELRNQLEPVYFYIGVSYLVEYSNDPDNELLKESIKWFDRLETEFPAGNFAIMAHQAQADAYRGLQQFSEAGEVLAKLLSPPLEGRLSNRQRLESLEKISEAYYVIRDWEKGEQWFRALLRESRDPDMQAMAAAALMEGYISRKQFQNALNLFPFLVGENPARYNLQFNLALIEAGDLLAEEENYTEAMLIYRMVLQVEDIIAWQERRLENLQGRLNRLNIVTGARDDRVIELETDIFNTKAQLEALRQLDSYSAELQIRIARNYLLTRRDWESFFAYRNLIENYPDHENIEDFVYAAFTGATNIGLLDEVIRLGEKYRANPAWLRYGNDIAVKLGQFYLERGQQQEFFDLARTFIEEHPDDRYTSQFVYLMGSTWAEDQAYHEMSREFRELIRRFPNSPMIDGANYWAGMAHLFLQEYDVALKHFRIILNDFPASPYAEDALYRQGICHFGMDNLAQAKQDFELFIRYYPDTVLRGEAEFFLGDIEGTLGNVPRALEHYRAVERYTDNMDYITSAYFQAGGLLEGTGRYEEMAANFKLYLERFGDRGDPSLALYEIGRAYDFQGRPDLMIETFIQAISDHADNPEFYGVDNILRAYPQKHHANRSRLQANHDFLEQVVNDSAFRRTIAEDRQAVFNYFRRNPYVEESVRRPFFDRLFRVRLLENQQPARDMLEANHRDLQRFPQQSPEQVLNALLAENQGRGTMAFRLQKTLQEIGAEVDVDVVFTEADFDVASPASLIWMGDQSRDFDPNIARLAYRTVIDRHSDSDFVFNAYLALAELEQEEQNYEDALTHLQEVERRFPGRPEVYRAILLQGDVLRRMGRKIDARAKYDQVIANRDWRGAPHAEALFKSGMSHFEDDQWDRAHTFFERVYLGYVGFPEWAANAYYYAGQSLERGGHRDDARRTYDEFLQNPVFQNHARFNDVTQARANL